MENEMVARKEDRSEKKKKKIDVQVQNVAVQGGAKDFLAK